MKLKNAFIVMYYRRRALQDQIYVYSSFFFFSSFSLMFSVPFASVFVRNSHDQTRFFFVENKEFVLILLFLFLFL